MSGMPSERNVCLSPVDGTIGDVECVERPMFGTSGVAIRAAYGADTIQDRP